MTFKKRCAVAKTDMAKTARPRRKARSTGRVSEELFERYLQAQGAEFDHEPAIPGKKKHPDYRVHWNGVDLFCEVKGLFKQRPFPSEVTGGPWDPYRRIRDKIEKAREKFKEYKDHCCVMVIHNVDDWEFNAWPWSVYGAMLGNAGLQIPFDASKGRLQLEHSRQAFLDRGKMIAPKTREAVNTTIAAIARLSEFRVPNPAFARERRKRLDALGRAQRAEPSERQAWDIGWKLKDELPMSLGSAVRIELFENPYAARPVANSVFRGTYDARFQYDLPCQRIKRTFAGTGLVQAETEDNRDILQRVDRFKEAVVREFQPERIILFGSRAYGDPEPDADVDLLVIFPGEREEIDRSLDIRMRVPCDFSLDLLTRSMGEIARRVEMGDSFVREILEHGKVLYASSDA